METITYTAPAISCGQCQRTVEAAVCALAGVEGVRVVVPTREVTVRFDPGQLPRERIEATLAGAGYPARGGAAGPDRVARQVRLPLAMRGGDTPNAR